LAVSLIPSSSPSSPSTTPTATRRWTPRTAPARSAPTPWVGARTPRAWTSTATSSSSRPPRRGPCSSSSTTTTPTSSSTPTPTAAPPPIGPDHPSPRTYDTNKTPAGDAALLEFARKTMLPEIGAAAKEHAGLDTFWYGNFEKDHTVWETYPDDPRFGINYI